MRLFVLLIEKNVLEQIRDIKRNILMIILPMAIFFCLYLYFQSNNIELNFINPIHMGIILEDDSIYSQMLVNDFQSKGELSDFFLLEQGDEESIMDAFDKHELDGTIRIPEDFVTSLMYFDYQPMEINIHQDDPVTTMILYNAFTAYEKYILSVEKGISAFYDVFRDQVDKEDYWAYNDALSIELIMAMINRNDMYDFKPVINIPAAATGTYYYVALTIMFVMLLSLFLSIQLIEERKSQTFLRLNTTKISIGHYLTSKVFANGMIVFGAYLIWSIIFSLFSDDTASLLLPKSLLFMLLLSFTSVIIGSCITLIVGHATDMVLLSSVFVFFSGVLGGSIIPMHFMPEGLKKLSAFTPNYHLIRHMLFISGEIRYDGFWTIISILFGIGILGFALLFAGYTRVVRRGSIG